MSNAVKAVNLAMAFILELAMLAAFAWWGFHTGNSAIVRILLGVGVPVLVAVIWGIFMAPNSSRRFKGAAYLSLKFVLFGLAVAALVAVGQTTLGIILGVVFLVNTVLLYVWR